MTGAFYGSPLSSVTLPTTLTSISGAAFQFSQLNSIVIPEGVTSIGANAFRGTPLTSVSLPSTLTTIGFNAFANTLLTDLIIPEGVTEIASGAFQGSSITSVSLPSTLRSIADSAFAGTQITSIVIPEGVTSIGVIDQDIQPGDFAKLIQSSSILQACLGTWETLLQECSNNGRLADAAREAFEVSSLGVDFELILQSFAAGDFSPLPAISLLSSTRIGGSPGAYSVQTDTIYLNYEWLPNASQDEIIAVLSEELGHHLEALVKQGDTPGDEGEFFSRRLLGESLDESAIQTLRQEDDSGFISANGQTLAAEKNSGGDAIFSPIALTTAAVQTPINKFIPGVFAGCKISEITLPDSLEVIGTGAFAQSGLQSVVIPIGVKSIGPGAFYGTELQEIFIPDSVDFIGDYAFAETQIARISIPEGMLFGQNAIPSSATLTIRLVNDGPGSLGHIALSSGSNFEEGVSLSAGSISGDPDGDALDPLYSYQWYKDNAIITGATGSTYEVSSIDAGKYKVAVTYSDGQEFRTTLTSLDQNIDKVDNGQGILSAIISNSAFNEGVTLAAGGITGDPDGTATIAGYQWYFNDTIITSATSSTYTVSNTGYGNYKVAVTYLDGQQYSTTLTSSNQAVSKIDNGNAVISVSGSAVVGSIVTASVSTPDPDGNGTFTYQWQSLSGSSWVNIVNATAAAYTLTSNEVTKPVRVVVTSTDMQGYGPIALSSNQTSAVTAPPDSTAPTITGISVQGTTVILNFSEQITPTGLSATTFTVMVGGTKRTVSSFVYDSTNKNKVTLTLSGTGPASSGRLKVSYTGTSVKDLSGNSLGTFSNRSADSFFSGASVTSLYADYTNLTLTGTSGINGTGNAKNNTIVGNQAKNTINGAAGADVLTGLGGVDTFVYTTLTNSLLGYPSGYTFDRITDLVIGTDRIDGSSAVSTANVRELGAVSALTQTDIAAVLTSSTFVRNGAATFSFLEGTTTRTYLALNNGTSGYSSTTDAIIEITGFTGALTNLAIV